VLGRILPLSSCESLVDLDMLRLARAYRVDGRLISPYDKATVCKLKKPVAPTYISYDRCSNDHSV